MNVFEKISLIVNRLMIWVAGLFLVAMIGLACANILFRLVWVPIAGTYELMGFFGAVAAAFALGFTQLKKGHISVDILVLYFSKTTRRFLTAVNSLICAVFFVLFAWQISKYGRTLSSTGEVTQTLNIIYHPFVYAVSAGCAALSLTFLVGFLKSLFSGKEGDH